MKYFNIEPFVYDSSTDLYFKSSDKVYDMHNDADFIKFEYDVYDRKVVIR